DGTRVPRLGLHHGRIEADPDGIGVAAQDVLDKIDPQGRGGGRDPGVWGSRYAYRGRDRYRRDQQTGSLHGASFPLGPARISPRWHQLCSDTRFFARQRLPVAMRLAYTMYRGGGCLSAGPSGDEVCDRSQHHRDERQPDDRVDGYRKRTSAAAMAVDELRSAA